MRTRWIDVVVIIIGRKHGVLAGPDRMMDWIIPPAATQAHQGAVTLAAVMVPRTLERPWGTAHRRQEHHENDVDQRFRGNVHHSGSGTILEYSPE